MSHDDFQTEPIKGLPELLPPGEKILWQGSPRTWSLAKQGLRIGWAAGWFGLIFLWRTLAGAAVTPWAQAVSEASFFLMLGGVVCAMLWLVALIQARSTVYTVTNRRVALRIGAALTMTVNLPYKQVANASLARARDGSGTIAFEMKAGSPILSYPLLWPHVRPWRLRVVEPALRCIPDPDRVAGLLTEAAVTEVSQPVISIRPNPVAAE